MKPFSFIARSVLAALVGTALLVSAVLFVTGPLTISTIAYQSSLSAVAVTVIALHYALNGFHLDLSPENSKSTLMLLAADFGLGVLAFLSFMLATRLAGTNLWQVGIGSAMMTGVGITVAAVLVKNVLSSYDPLLDLGRSIASHRL